MVYYYIFPVFFIRLGEVPQGPDSSSSIPGDRFAEEAVDDNGLEYMDLCQVGYVIASVQKFTLFRLHFPTLIFS